MSTNSLFGNASNGGLTSLNDTSPKFTFGIPGGTQVSTTSNQIPTGGLFGTPNGGAFGNFVFGTTPFDHHGSPTNGVFGNSANISPGNSNVNGGFGFGYSNGATGGAFSTPTGKAPICSTLFGHNTGGNPTMTGGFGFGNGPFSGGFANANGGTMSTGAVNPTRPFTSFGASTSGGSSGYNNSFFNIPGPTGTAIRKHAPVIVQTAPYSSNCERLQCISCMAEYGGKSLEELRMEDYSAGRSPKHMQSVSGYGVGSNGSTRNTTPGSTSQLLFGQNPSIAGGSDTGGFGTNGANAPSTSSTGWPPAARNAVWPSNPRKFVSPSSTRNNSRDIHAATNPGTSLVKYSFVSGHDDVLEDIQSGWRLFTRLHCITAMDAYQGKSLEELRMEDYAAGRKGRRPGELTWSAQTGLLRSIEEVWRCPVCLEQVSPPLQMCEHGHIFCKKCCARLSCCPVCRVRFSKVPARAVEQVLELLPRNQL